MKCLETSLPGVKILEPAVFRDERGYFYESYNARTLETLGIPDHFVQDNQAFSSRGVLRGLHYQVGEYAQSKLVRVVQGEVFDVAVDIRPDSPHYGKWFGVKLSGENMRQLYVPRGFAHGYLVLSETAIFSYKCDNFYAKAFEGGIRFDDPAIGIEWGMDRDRILVSEKDKLLPTLADALRFE